MYTADSDIIIIGAGLLGCAAARALRKYDLSVTVLEKSSDVCTGISKGNSGIIYAGYDDTPGSLKAEMVVRACKRFPQLCRELDVHYRNTGSLMIGCGPRSEGVIRKKYEQGIANGVQGLELLSGEEVLKKEPLVSPHVRIGLFAPGTSTVDPWELCIALYENACANGAIFCMDSEVQAISRTDGGFKVDTSSGIYTARSVINCAGMSAGIIREMTEEPRVRIIPNACDYFVLGIPDSSAPSSVIFHEPEYKGKGLTLIPTVNGEILAGSTQRHDPELAGRPTSDKGLARIMDLCSEVVPDMPLSPVIHSFAAFRPNPFEVYMPDESEKTDSDRPWGDGYIPSDTRLRDFNILEEQGLFSLIGIKTPGLTCSVELGEYIADKVVSYFENDVMPARAEQGAADFNTHPKVRLNTDYDPIRRATLRFADIPAGRLEDEVARHPDLGRVVCTCRKISEYEIRQAVRHGANTLDGVKRRTGVLMGRCQGSKCLSEVLKIMSEELQIPQEEIIKDDHSSSRVI